MADEKVTKEEFEESYIQKSGITREQYEENFVTLPCYCSYEHCKGWACVSKNEFLIKAHMEFRGTPPAEVYTQLEEGKVKKGGVNGTPKNPRPLFNPPPQKPIKDRKGM